jgi:phosphatidylglycerol:prolipoprotein diacylglycerol transferase
MGGAIVGIMLLVDRKLGEKRPRGLLIALFLVLYFMARFIVEFFKEFQGDLKEVGGLTMGQLLSIPLFLAGVAWMIWSIRRKLPAASVIPGSAPEAPFPKAAPRKSGKKRR